MRRLMALAVAVAVLTLAAGCGGESASGPPDIEYGRDVCDQCHMIISEPRFAAAFRDADGKPFVFDDISEMLVYLSTRELPAEDRVWVHDYETEEWLDAPAAWYVRGQIATPMGGGIVAFSAEAEARTFAGERDGEVLSWTEVLNQTTEPTMGSHSSP